MAQHRSKAPSHVVQHVQTRGFHLEASASAAAGAALVPEAAASNASTTAALVPAATAAASAAVGVQAASDVYSPVSGEVVEINGALVDEPAKVSSAAGEEHCRAGGRVVQACEHMAVQGAAGKGLAGVEAGQKRSALAGGVQQCEEEWQCSVQLPEQRCAELIRARTGCLVKPSY